VCHSFNLIKKERMGCRALLLPNLLRVVCLVVELKGKYFNLESELIISDMFETLIFPPFHPLVEFLDELAVPKLNISFIQIKSLGVLNPNVKVFRKYNLLCHSNLLFLYNLLDTRLALLLKLLLMLIVRLQVSLPESLLLSTLLILEGLYLLLFLVFNVNF
jgi:hypothetical protein